MNEHDILNSKINYLRNFLRKDSIRENDIEMLIRIFSEFTFISGLTFKYKLEGFRRVTINSRIFKGEEKRITDIEHLKNPPKDLINRYGRANLTQNSILYATDNPITALAEMRPKVGQMITISTWKRKTDYDVTVASIFKNSPTKNLISNGMTLRAQIEYHKIKNQHDKNLLKLIEEITQFICDCFSKEVNDDNHFDYFLSSHYANQIFTVLQNGEVDAIFYPSVRQSLELTNIAMKPDVFKNNYELEHVEENIITGDLTTNSGWTMLGSGESSTFNNGKIVW